jgi:hypothetical protein
MRIIRPFTVDDTSFTSSTVSEASPAAWNSGTTYAMADTVSLNHRIYESLQAGNLNKDPATETAWWLDTGPTNRWAMFDNVMGTVTSDADEIVVVIDTTSRITSVALLNVSGASEVTVLVESGATEVYNQTHTFVSSFGIDDWYQYFFAPIDRKANLVITDIPPYGAVTVTVTVTGTGSTVGVGNLILGLDREIGSTVYGASLGIVDYSTKTADAWGNYSITERAYSSKGRFTVWIDNTDIDNTMLLLATYRATPVVWYGADDYASTALFGFYREADISIAYPTQSILTIDIEGLT